MQRLDSQDDSNDSQSEAQISTTNALSARPSNHNLNPNSVFERKLIKKRTSSKYQESSLKLKQNYKNNDLDFEKYERVKMDHKTIE